MRKSVHTAGYVALRKHLTSARHDAGLSQRELAAKLDVPHSVIAKIESGERRIDPVEFCWFLKACRVDPIDPFTEVADKAGSPLGGRRRASS